jgi:hypothetical protein
MRQSTREVLPWSTWAMMAMLRTSVRRSTPEAEDTGEATDMKERSWKRSGCGGGR